MFKSILKRVFQISILLLTLFGSLRLYYNKQIGEIIDSYNGVEVYFNSIPFTTKGENFSEDGYYYGEKYQALEFVKRYYFEVFNHRLEDIKDVKELYNHNLKDGEFNRLTMLTQYSNPSNHPIKEGDILVFKPNFYNSDGHVAIISKVSEDKIEIVQQNCWKSTRKELKLESRENKWYIADEKVVGRLER